MDPELLLLPALIFLGRIADTSIGTVRIVLLIAGSRWTAALLGFVEVSIWALATGGVVSNLDNPLTVGAFAGGFSVGVLIGIAIEERIALGFRVIHVYNNNPAIDVSARLREHGYRVTRLEGHGLEGAVETAVLLIRRRSLRRARELIEETAPQAFVTIERAERPLGALPPADSRFGRFHWGPLFPLGGIRK